MPQEKTDLDSPDLIKRKQFIKEFGVLLIAVEQGLKRDSQSLLINPTNYTIHHGDIGYFIAHTKEKVNKALNKLVIEGSRGTISEKISEQYERENLKENSNETIKSIYGNLRRRNSNWKQKIPIYTLKKDRIFDLNSGDSLRGFFSNHIIIKGTLLDLKNILPVLRYYSDRPVLVFSEKEVDFSKWNKIKETHRNVFYVRGLQHSLSHVHELEPLKAYKILILTEATDSSFLDTDTIVFARILKEFFKVNKILVELADESMIRFLEIKPKFKLLTNLKEMSFLWPSFVSGNIHYDSLLMSLAAKSLYNPNWILFFKELSNPRVYRQTQIGNSRVIKENSNICMLKVTTELAAKVSIYGKLQYLLMSHEPCIIALALLKIRRNKNLRMSNVALDQIKEGEKFKNSNLKENILKTVNSVYGSKFFLTNPSYFTRLSPGDKILVLGTDDLTQKINEATNKIGVAMVGRIKESIKKQKKKLMVPVGKLKKKKEEMDFKLNLKSEIFEMVKDLNNSMRHSIACLDMFHRKEKIRKQLEAEKNKKVKTS